MQFRRFRTQGEGVDVRAVAPIVSVILMVAVAVILGATISVFALGVGEKTTDVGPSASFDFEYNSDTATVDVTHSNGDTIRGDRLRFGGAAVEKTTFGGITEWAGRKIRAGDKASVAVVPGETLRILWRDDEGEDSAVLAEYEVPDRVPKATNAVIGTLDLSNAAGRYSLSPKKNGFAKIELTNVQPSTAQVYVEISDDNSNSQGSDTITDTIIVRGGSTSTISYEMCADLVTTSDTVTVTVYDEQGGTQLAQDSGTASNGNGTPAILGCSEHPG